MGHVIVFKVLEVIGSKKNPLLFYGLEIQLSLDY